MGPIKDLKGVQRVMGCLAALSRFISRLGEKGLPLYRLLRKTERFTWTPEAEEALGNLKALLTNAPILVPPAAGEALLIYVAATTQVVSAAIVVERREEGHALLVQRPVYFISEVLSETKIRYPQIQKLLYAVILTRRKLRHYFESHPVTVVSSFPLGEIIQCREASGRIAKWAVEIMGETISFAPRKAIKSQVLADFVAEWVDTQLPTAPIQPELWTMYFDGSLMKTGVGAGLLFISPLRKHLCYVLHLHFPTSNNVAEYEALVNGLRIAIELGVRRLDARGDSQLVIDQVMKNSHCRDRNLEAYCDEVRHLEDKFYGLELNQVARWYNETVDELAKIASGRTTVPLDVFSRDIHQPSVNTDDTPEPEEASAQPEASSATEGEALRIKGERNGVTPNRNWQTPYLQYLHRGELPLDKAEAQRLAWRAKSFVLLGDEKELYHRSPSGIHQHHASLRGPELHHHRQWHPVHLQVPGLLRGPPHPCVLGRRGSPHDEWAGRACQRYASTRTKTEDLQRPQQVRQAMDEGTTLGGLESKDDAKPSHGLLVVLSSLWGRGYLAHRLRIRFPEDEGVRRPKQPDQQEDSLDQLEEARDMALLHSVRYQQSLRCYHAQGVRP
jgi:ribonuclease HI